MDIHDPLMLLFFPFFKNKIPVMTPIKAIGAAIMGKK